MKCRRQGCPYDAYRDRCYFHEKERQDLFNSVSRTSSDRPRSMVLDSAVLDDEQREIADLLEILGTDPRDIKNAVARRAVARRW